MPVLIVECGDKSEVCIARAPGVEPDAVSVVEADTTYQAVLHMIEQLTTDQIYRLQLWDIRNCLRVVAARERENQEVVVEEEPK